MAKESRDSEHSKVLGIYGDHSHLVSFYTLPYLLSSLLLIFYFAIYKNYLPSIPTLLIRILYCPPVYMTGCCMELSHTSDRCILSI